jgi:hypothetical protein
MKRLGLLEVARRLGLRQVDRGHLEPCPACGEQRRSRHDDRRGPVFLCGRGQGWTCSICGAKGGVVEMVSHALLGCRLGPGDPRWEELRAVAAEAGLCGPKAPPPPPPPPPIPRPRIVEESLTQLWERSTPVDADPEVASWLVSRGLSPATVADLDLARALPVDGLDRWAAFRGTPWSRGWRCVFRCFDEAGRLASLRARWVRPEPPPPGTDKAGAAAGGAGSAGGAVLACGLGRQVLQRGRAPSWWPREQLFAAVVVEGEPDWLTWACRSSGPTSPAVFGVYNGSWSPELAARVPDGARVAVRTHHDEAGDRYARTVSESLWHRCHVTRSRPPENPC